MVSTKPSVNLRVMLEVEDNLVKTIFSISLVAKKWGLVSKRSARQTKTQPSNQLTIVVAASHKCSTQWIQMLSKCKLIWCSSRWCCFNNNKRCLQCKAVIKAILIIKCSNWGKFRTNTQHSARTQLLSKVRPRPSETFPNPLRRASRKGSTRLKAGSPRYRRRLARRSTLSPLHTSPTTSRTTRTWRIKVKARSWVVLERTLAGKRGRKHSRRKLQHKSTLRR